MLKKGKRAKEKQNDDVANDVGTNYMRLGVRSTPLQIMIILIIVFITIIGFSYSIFSDYINSAINSTAGTVKLAPATLLVEQDPNGNDTDYTNNMLPTPITNWQPGDVTTIEWTVSNAGNKSIYTKNTLEIAWDVGSDKHEQNIVYLYPVTMTDDEIRADILNNNASRSNQYWK